MKLRFTKMQGAGNDFVMLDATRSPLQLSPEQYRALADRHFGIGADQILVVEPPRTPGVDFGYRIFNASGDEVEHCGNGARCFVRFVRDEGLTTKSTIRVETISGIIEPHLTASGEVTVDMGTPAFEPARVPFDTSGLVARIEHEESLWPIALDGGERWIATLSMGNPHAVQIVDDVDAAPVTVEGQWLETHPRFPQRVNAGYMQIVDRRAIRLRVWERGAGETLACGTGACAAVVSGIRRGRLQSPVAVSTRGGRLTIAWDGGPVWMTGPATPVFEGEIDL
jgi:diaminopimelate epimerase